MTQLTLHPVTQDNWIACAKLELPESQRGYVAPNVYSIAESKFEPHYQPRVILLDEEVAGRLYARLGFRRVGVLEDGDIQLQRDF